jgi:hypothetical protein
VSTWERCSSSSHGGAFRRPDVRFPLRCTGRVPVTMWSFSDRAYPTGSSRPIGYGFMERWWLKVPSAAYALWIAARDHLGPNRWCLVRCPRS